GGSIMRSLPSDHAIRSLAQLAYAVGLGLADQELIEEGADLEQPLDLAEHAAQRELALLLGGGAGGEPQDPAAGAADIRDVLQIEHDLGAPGLHQRAQPFAEFLGGGGIEPAVGLDDGDAVSHLFHQLHARSLHRHCSSFLTSRSRLSPALREYSS